MIITDDFVYIHMPKTGGTFATEAISRVYQSRPRDILTALLPKTLLTGVPTSLVNINKHGTCREIPPAHRDKPIVATVRNPYDRYVSQYEFGWWKTHPPCDVQQIQETYPHFPDLSFEEFVSLWNSVVLRMEIKNVDFANQESFGFQTWQFVDFFFKEPSEVLPRIGLRCDARREYEADMFDVHFVRTDRLNQGLFEFLLAVGHSRKKVEFVLGLEKIYPKEGGRSRQTWDEYYTPALKRRVRAMERLIFAILPEFDV